MIGIRGHGFTGLHGFWIGVDVLNVGYLANGYARPAVTRHGCYQGRLIRGGVYDLPRYTPSLSINQSYVQYVTVVN